VSVRPSPSGTSREAAVSAGSASSSPHLWKLLSSLLLTRCCFHVAGSLRERFRVPLQMWLIWLMMVAVASALQLEGMVLLSVRMKAVLAGPETFGMDAWVQRPLVGKTFLLLMMVGTTDLGRVSLCCQHVAEKDAQRQAASWQFQLCWYHEAQFERGPKKVAFSRLAELREPQECTHQLFRLATRRPELQHLRLQRLEIERHPLRSTSACIQSRRPGDSKTRVERGHGGPWARCLRQRLRA